MGESVNRRTFLASAGAGTAALALGGSARAAGPNDRLNVAVVGIRGRGGSHIDGFGANKNTRIATLCDIDTREFEKPAKEVEKTSGQRPQLVQDLRRVLDDKDIDIVSIATPNHWHSLATVWACQAGKDVYVEKPVSHNVMEGVKMAEAAKKFGRIVQAGTQNRSSRGVQAAIEFLRSGKLGQIYLAKGLCYKPRASIGSFADGSPPAGVDFNLWLGPAPERPFNQNRFHYNWHWFWDTGNGDIGNQGIHQMDVARWGLGKSTLPTHIESSGGRFGYVDQGETPNTQVATYRYDDCMLVFEVRGLPTNDEMGVKIGNLFFGSEGYMAINGGTWATYLGPKGEPGPKSERGSRGGGDGNHFDNFVDAVLARDPKKLTAEVTEGHLSSALCHLGNIAYRLGRAVNFDPKTMTCSEPEATAMLSREYRAPFVMPASL